MNEATAFLTLVCEPESPRWARRHASNALGAWRISPEVGDVVLLIVSELVTNASRAATSVTVSLRLLPGQLLIEVADDNPAPPVLKDADLESENGRGLLLVEALSRDWGFQYPKSGGKVVFAVLGMPEASPWQLAP